MLTKQTRPLLTSTGRNGHGPAGGYGKATVCSQSEAGIPVASPTGRSWPDADRRPAKPTDCFPKRKGQFSERSDILRRMTAYALIPPALRRFSKKVAAVCCWPRPAPPSDSNSTRLNGRLTLTAFPQTITLVGLSVTAFDSIATAMGGQRVWLDEPSLASRKLAHLWSWCP